MIKLIAIVALEASLLLNGCKYRNGLSEKDLDTRIDVIKENEKDRNEIRILYNKIEKKKINDNISAGSTYPFEINGRTYHVVAFEESGMKTLEIEIYYNGIVQKIFSDEGLDGFIEYE